MNTRKFTYSFRNRCYIKIIFMAKTTISKKNSKFRCCGRKKLENLCQFQFSNKYPFSFLTYLPMRFIGWKLNKEFSDVFRLTLLNLSQLKQHYIWKK